MTSVWSTTTVEAVSGGLRGGSSLRIPMSFDDFVALGETKHHEWYDGMCIVNPPSGAHALAAKRLTAVLDRCVPDELIAIQEWGWHSPVGMFEPDIMVVESVALREKVAVRAPLLVVEILSPSTRTEDLIVKRAKYGEVGLAWYWIVDLDALTLEVLQNVDGVLVDVQTITAEAPSETIGPFPVTVDPTTLMA
jgi:Uma2 family endonuclease